MFPRNISLSGFDIDYHRSGLNFIKLDGDIGCLGRWDLAQVYPQLTES